ncbi:MAG: hypothetical protein JWQ87_3605 [Candidatus Sulfotelmatobacter sp.]|nr:hypothetical protein [Candidatus Sulfotelmatobacter sp.]
MKVTRLSHILGLSLNVAIFSVGALSQETAISQPAQSVASTPDRIQVEQALQRYLAALVHRSLPELVTVWPDLGHQKKEYERIKRHLEDTSVSDDRISLQPLEIEVKGDEAVVKAQRTEEFVKTEYVNSASHGILMSNDVPMHDPSTDRIPKKKNKKKMDTLSIDLHRAGDSWKILSITEQKH